ncbi:two-component response regulator ORR24-like [Impatiens glandulifera]|uniref:two-component response regulator ORR24-like n=1 Tax=Impatiens glandulifera TaxID=253017 RepID=UPI001FB0A3D5|nr:two-component response regulator ORR24-like [Impatiens glandulifera]
MTTHMRETSTFQSMGDKEICILVVDDDPICENIIGRMLQHCCHYEAITPYEKGSSSSSSALLLQQVETGVVTKLCFLKSMSMDEFKRVWQHAYTNEKEKGNNLNNTINPAAVAAAAVEDNGSLSSNQKKRGIDQENNNNGSACSSHKKRAVVEESDQDSTKEESKQRIVWNQWMHLKFVDAIRQLGPDRAIPKKIVEVMNIPGLTRENVASHLQKHRMNIKRAEEKSRQMSPITGFHQTNHYNQHPYQFSTESSSLFQSSLCPPNYSYTQQQQPLFGLSNQFLNNNNNHASSGFIQVDHNQAVANNSTALISSDKNTVNEPSGNSYIGFRLTGNGISVETGRQMINCPVTEMVNELSDEGSIFLQYSAESSSIDDPFFPNVIQPQQMMNPIQGINNDMVLELDNSGVEIDLDDLLKNAEAADERSVSPNEFMFNGCIFDDILFNNVD